MGSIWSSWRTFPLFILPASISFGAGGGRGNYKENLKILNISTLHLLNFMSILPSNLICLVLCSSSLVKRLPREVVDAPSVVAFKARDRMGHREAWSGEWQPYPWQGHWKWMGCKVLSNPSCSMILWPEIFSFPYRFFILSITWGNV